MNRDKRQQWYKLDNSAILYAAIRRANFSSMYRFSVLMRDRVDRELLQKALDTTLPRFPMFDVRVKKGLFWQYLDRNSAPAPVVQADVANPCMPMRDRWDRSDLLRVFYYENRISIEMFHILADGTGALVFFKTLLAVYLRLQGVEVPDEMGVASLSQPPDPEEYEDAYLRYAKRGGATRGMKEGAAYKYSGEIEPFYTLNVIRGLMPCDAVLEKARAKGVSLTEYLAAVLIRAFLVRQSAEAPRKLLPVALAVPIDLRSFFPTRTLRNFILSLRPSIDPSLGDYSFDDILSHIHHYMRLYSDKYQLMAQLTANVRLSKNPLLTPFPLPVKDFFIDLLFRHIGDRQYTTTMTNPGRFTVPEAMRPYILQAEAMIGPAYTARPSCAVMSYENVLTVVFAGTIRESDVEREFFTFLVKEGIPVKLESNRR